MKNKLFCGILISLSIPAANGVTNDDGLNIGSNYVPGGLSWAAAIGETNDADTYSLAVGYRSSAFGWSTIVGGEGSRTDASTSASLVMGTYNALYRTRNSGVFGSGNLIDIPYGYEDNSSFIAGGGNTIDGGGGANILLGSSNKVSGGLASALIGTENTSSVSNSWVFGKGHVGQEDTVTLGTYSNQVANSALIVGTGWSASSRSNGLVVLKSGEVKIPGTLTIGSEAALTPSYLTTNNYLKKINGTGATGSASSVVVLGGYATGNGIQSVAIGQYSTTGGIYATALGGYASATNPYTLAVGYESAASAYYSTAIGYQAKASGEQSIAFQGGESSGPWSISFTKGKAIGSSSFATLGSTASGANSIALAGYYTGSGYSTASGYSAALVGGAGSIASGDVSFTSGFQTQSEAAHSAVFGSRNLSAGTALTGSATTWVENEALFEVGNGAPSASPAVYSNAITTLKNGQTTLANKFWSASTPKAVPAGADASAGEALVVDGHTRLNGKVTLAQAQGDISMGIYE